MEAMGKTKKILVEALFIISPVAISLLVFRLIKNFPLYPYITILGSLVSLLLIASLFLKVDFKWLLLIRSAGIGLLYLFWLKDTPFNFEGMFGDNHYYTLALEKFYHSFLSYSHEYKNIHFSLPPLFFFLIGRIGALLKVPLLDVLKYSSYLFVVYLPYLWGYFLGGIFKKDKWLAAFLLSLLIPFKNPLPEYSSLAYLAQKGWHFLGMFLIIVWYLWLKREKPHFLSAGIAAGVLFALDFSPFIFIFMAIIFELLSVLYRDLRGSSGFAKSWRNLSIELFYYVRLGIVALLVNLVWLLPVIKDLFTHRLGPYFNNYFAYSEGHASIFQSLALLDPFDLFSIVLIIGLGNLFLPDPQRQEIDSLRRIFFGMILFALIFYSLAFAKIPMPMHHFSMFILHVMALAAVFFFIKFKHHVLLPIGVSLLVLASVWQLNDNKQNQYALKQSQLSAAIYKRGEVLRQKYDFYEKIIFPTTNELFFGKKTYSFITADFFSDAAASFDDRLEYIRAIYRHKEAGQAAAFSRALKNTPFGEVGYILLQKGKGDQLFFSVNAYHNDLKEFRSKRKFFYFSGADFPGEYFKEIYDDDDFKVFKLN
jgi:hypothetical protein